MEKKEIRLLKAEEIECRVATISEKGVQLLLYKDARVDQKILDESFGLFNWQRSHQCIDGSIYCTVSVYDQEKKEWISKQDVGSAGFTEKEKSLASDSFKRACVSIGIGRELYSAPFIWIPASKIKIQKKGEKWCCNSYFSVKEIAYSNDREISALTIVDEIGNTVYEMKEIRHEETKEAELTSRQKACLKAELKRTGVTREAVQSRYHIEDLEKMPEAVYKKVMYALGRTESANAA